MRFLNGMVKCYLLLLYLIMESSHANGAWQYRPPHHDTCYQIEGHDIECGNFQISSAIIAKKYRVVSAADDVLSSMSLKTHPGDYPVLHRLAIRLGYFNEYISSVSNMPLSVWRGMTMENRGNLLGWYSSIATTDQLENDLSNYLNSCLNYWADPRATFDDRIEEPTLAEVSALCIADSGVLDW